jgi:parvulin-like peptidyl-prolyl isomerase
MIIARVGEQHILAGDVLPAVNQAIEPLLEQIPPSELDPYRSSLMRQALQRVIETKLLFQDFQRSVPKDRLPQIRHSLSEEFDEKQLDAMMEKTKVSTATELEAKLRRYGSSIRKQRYAYIEQQLGRYALAQNVTIDPEVTHQEMVDYYRENVEDYKFPARATWEQLTVRFDKFPNKQAAYEALCWMGNEADRGVPFAVVAREHSQGVNADEGGVHGWTPQGSLVSKALDHAIFTAPLNQLGPIIEDERGFHIVRVLGREEAGKTLFPEVQKEIEERLKKKKRDREIEQYVKRLRESTPVWTVFDGEDAAQAQRAAQQRGAPHYPR